MAALTGARLVAVLAQFVAGVLAARLLQPAALGAASVGLSAGWVLSIVANGGLNISAIYYLGRRPGRARALVQALLPLLAVALAAALVLAVVSTPLVGPLTLSRPGWQALPLLVAAGVLATGTVGFEVSGSVLLGLHDRRGYVLADLTRSVCTLLAVLVLLVGPMRTAIGYVLATAVGVAAPALWLGARVRRRLGPLRPRWDAGFAREVARTGVKGQPSNVLTFLTLRLDMLLVPALVGLGPAGVYFVATRVAEVVAQLSNAAAAMLFPHVAASAADQRHATRTTERVMRLTLTGTVLGGAVLAGCAPLLLSRIFGSAYRSGTMSVMIMLAAMVPLAMGRVLAADLKGRGRVGVVSIAAGVGVAVTVLADVTLLPVWGIAGAAAASVLAYAATAVMLTMVYRRATGAAVTALCPRPADVVELVRLLWRRLPRVGTAAA
jgi:O-antigen/teichoic acid export membrane protein